MRNNIVTGNFGARICALFLLATILANAFPPSAAAQTKRRVTVISPAAGKKIVSNETAFPQPPDSVLSQSWKTGELPQPLALPNGNTDEVVAVLAKKIRARDRESVPALLTALQIAGFFITDKTGRVLHAPPDGKGQGLPINGWEVASAARMYGDNRTVNLSELDWQLKSVPVLRGFAAEQGGSVASVLMDGIRKNADNTRNPFLRIWARLIVELGNRSAGKDDLASGAGDAGQINLDAIQHLLIMRRLYGDFWATAEKYKNETVRGESENERRNQSQARFLNANFSSNSAPNFAANDFEFSRFADAIDDAKKPDERCRMDGDAPTIFDGIATSLGMAWDAGLERASESSDADIKKAGSKYAAFMTAANILLVYAKFIQTYAALEVTITAEDSAPLIRTKNAVPGARKKLRALVRLNIGEWQKYNCLRTAMNLMTGLDFSTLNDGPLGGVGVQWGLTQGGARDFYSNSTGINESGEQIVGFAAEKPKRIQDAGVGAGNRGLGNLTFNKTDDQGTTDIVLEGTPQRNAKLGKLNQVRKHARVTTSIEIKAGEIKGDLVDVYGQWADGLPGMLTMPAELLYRTSWAASGALVVPVVDWEECTGDWAGTVTYTRTHKLNESKTEKLPSARGESTITREIDNLYNAQIAVNGGQATASILAGTNFTETRDTWEMNACRNNAPMRRMSCSIVRKQKTNGAGGGAANVRIVVNRSAGTYGISGRLPEIQGFASGDERGTCSGQCQPLYVKPTNYNYKGTIEAETFQVADQKLSASNALELVGSDTHELVPGVTIKITWNLRQCGSQAQTTQPQRELETRAQETLLSQNDFFAAISFFKPVDTFRRLFAHELVKPNFSARNEND